MQKIVTNENEAACMTCFFCTGVEIKKDEVVCKRCGSSCLIDKKGDEFSPQYGVAATFQTSQYTPPLPDRRVMNKPWPKYRERRNYAKI